MFVSGLALGSGSFDAGTMVLLVELFSRFRLHFRMGFVLVRSMCFYVTLGTDSKAFQLLLKVAGSLAI